MTTEDRGPTRRLLHDGWGLVLHDAARRALGTDHDEIAATVPGCVHTDLMAAGLLADPTIATNEDDQHWIGRSDWTYRLRFDAHPAAPGEHVDLAFDGIDTMATITLNGTTVGTTQNQHRRYRFDVGRLLRTGGNLLEVRLASPVATALSRRERLGDLPNPYGEPYNFIRKMACNFGWDWGPRLVTSGLWRPVGLERWWTARLASVRPTPVLAPGTPLPGEEARLDIAVDVERDRDSTEERRASRLEATVRAPGGAIVATTSATVGDRAAPTHLDVAVPDVRRWWPVGRGDQVLYDLEVALVDGDAVVDVSTRRIGFRHVQMDTTEDGDGAGARFAFVVNGERIWVRGFNWIPDDCFPSEVTAERAGRRIDAALAANANLLRVWGGGLYESDAFYDQCDEHGVLVWQDFAFACAPYPEELLWDEVAAEAADNIDRLMSHPSLLVWTGNNENLEGWADWGWQDAIGDRSWGAGFYYDLLPGLVASRDPHRPYLDGSPSSLDPALPPNDPARGPVHLWDVWNDLDYTHYRDHHPRFVAELGFQAPATWATLQRAFEGRPVTIDGPELAHRQRAFDGHAKLDRWLRQHFGDVTDYDDWLYLTQVNQAHAIETAVGHFRAAHERCSGVVWWQLNDCWPAISWAVVDSDGRPKPAWYAARRVFDDRLAVLRPAGDGVELVLVNDGRTPWRATTRLDRLAADGRELAGAELGVEFGVELEVEVAPGSAVRRPVPVPVTDAATTGHDLLVATVDHQRAVFTAAPDHGHAPLHAPAWDLEVSTGDGVVHVDIVARSLVRDLCLFADRIDPDARVDEQLLTLLPGERRRIDIRTTQRDPARWHDALAPPDGLPVVLRALGDRHLPDDATAVP